MGQKKRGEGEVMEDESGSDDEEYPQRVSIMQVDEMS